MGNFVALIVLPSVAYLRQRDGFEKTSHSVVQHHKYSQPKKSISRRPFDRKFVKKINAARWHLINRLRVIQWPFKCWSCSIMFVCLRKMSLCILAISGRLPVNERNRVL